MTVNKRRAAIGALEVNIRALLEQVDTDEDTIVIVEQRGREIEFGHNLETKRYPDPMALPPRPKTCIVTAYSRAALLCVSVVTVISRVDDRRGLNVQRELFYD